MTATHPALEPYALTYTDQDGASFTVRWDRVDAYDQRERYQWTISAGAEVIAAGDDLTARPGAPQVEALRALFAFLTAYSESQPDREAAGLFPDTVRPLADHIGPEGFIIREAEVAGWEE